MQCEWMVPYEEGTIEAVAYIDGKEVKRTSFSTSKQPSKLKTTVDKLDAEDNFDASYIITSESLDENDNLYPYGENRVYYNIKGDVNKISMENGNPIDPTSRTKSDFRSLFFGKTRLFLRQQPNAKKASIITGSIMGDKALYVSNTIIIDAENISILGDTKAYNLEILYTTNGDNPAINGLPYENPFQISDGTTVKAIVKQNGNIVLTMEETFGKNEGLFWGDEHSADIWIGRGVNISAEEGILKGSATASRAARRFKGTGFVDFKGKEGSVEFYQENDGEGGDYSIRIRYMHNNEGQLHPMKLYVNDEYIRTLEFKSTGGWEKEWAFVPTIIVLKSGANNIKLETTGESGPFIDELFVD